MSESIAPPAWAATLERVRESGRFGMRPIASDEFTINDWMQIHGLSKYASRSAIQRKINAEEIEVAGERLRYREGQKPVAGNILAYKFVNKENGKAQSDKTKRVYKKNSRAR